MENTKPIILHLEDAKAEIAEAINKQVEKGIPFFLLEPILKEYYTQVLNRKNAEVENARKNYEATKEGEVE